MSMGTFYEMRLKKRAATMLPCACVPSNSRLKVSACAPTVASSVYHQSVAKWIVQRERQFPARATDTTLATTVEVDELVTFVGKEAARQMTKAPQAGTRSFRCRRTPACPALVRRPLSADGVQSRTLAHPARARGSAILSA